MLRIPGLNIQPPGLHRVPVASEWSVSKRGSEPEFLPKLAVKTVRVSVITVLKALRQRSLASSSAARAVIDLSCLNFHRARDTVGC